MTKIFADAVGNFASSHDAEKTVDVGILFYGHPSVFMSLPEEVIKTIVCQMRGIQEHLVKTINIGGFARPNTINEITASSFSSFCKKSLTEEALEVYASTPAHVVSIAACAVTLVAEAQPRDTFYVRTNSEFSYKHPQGLPTDILVIKDVQSYQEMRNIDQGELLDWAASRVCESLHNTAYHPIVSADPEWDKFTITTEDSERTECSIDWIGSAYRMEFVGRICAKLNRVDLPIDMSSGSFYAAPSISKARH